MSDWIRADSLDGLFSPEMPPPLNLNRSQPPPRESIEAIRPQSVGPAGNGSKPVFADLFSASGRRNRKSYAYFCLAATALIVISLAVALVVGRSLQSLVPAVLVFLAVILPTFVSAIFVSAQRLRDFGWPGAATLIFLIPALGQFLNIALLVIPGNIGPNRYGDDPTQG